MLERIRQSPRFTAVVTAVFALLLLVAMFAGAPVRALVPALVATRVADICTTANSETVEATLVADAHQHDAVHVAQVRDETGDHASPADHSEHVGHHGADCVLCIAIAPPATLVADIHRPAVPPFHQRWQALWSDSGYLPGAPLPARGPPAFMAA